MGNNHCRDLGIRPDQAIGSKDLESIWARYEKKASVTNSGFLSENSTNKLLKDLASAAKVPYSDDVAKKLVKEHQDPQKKTLDYAQFKKLIKSLVQEEPRFHLTQSLQTKLEDEEPPVQQNTSQPETNVKKESIQHPISQSVTLTAEEKAKREEERVNKGMTQLPWRDQDNTRLRPITVVSKIANEVIYRPDRTFELVFGEDTSLPISVLEASFRFDIIPFLNSALIEIEMVITNNVVAKPIQGKLRLPLSKGAVISRFGYEAIAGSIVDGVVLPKKKAAAVEYLEKEKGRNVASTKKVEGDLFETTVFPLPYKEKRKMVIQYLSQLDSNTSSDGKTEWAVSIPFKFATPLESFCASFFVFPESDEQVITSSPSEARNTTLEEGFRVSGQHSAGWREQVMFAVGESEGLIHFAAHLSPQFVEKLFGSSTQSSTTTAIANKSKQIKVGVVWDKSDSMRNSVEENIQVLETLKKEYLEKNGQEVLMKVFVFNTFTTRIGESEEYLNFETIKKLLSEVEYDGGTDISSIDDPINQFCKEDVEMILLFSDGLDNIGHAKRIPQGVMDSTKPIHVFGPSQGNSNQALLGSIASRTGGLFESGSKINSVIGSVMGLTPAAHVSSLEIEKVVGDGSVGDLFFDEGFVTVPDWKLKNTGWTINENRGGFVTGTISKSNPVEKLSLNIQKGNETKTVKIEFGDSTSILTNGLARLIGLVHCQQAMNESRKLHVDPGFSSHYQTELALRYKIVSEETSLLFLLEAQQFIDNSIECPRKHPAFDEWARLFSNIDPKKKRQSETEAEVAKLRNKCKNLLTSLERVLNHTMPAPLSPRKETAMLESCSAQSYQSDFLPTLLCRSSSITEPQGPPPPPALASRALPPASAPPPSGGRGAPAPPLASASRPSIALQSGPPPPPGGPPTRSAAVLQLEPMQSQMSQQSECLDEDASEEAEEDYEMDTSIGAVSLERNRSEEKEKKEIKKKKSKKAKPSAEPQLEKRSVSGKPKALQQIPLMTTPEQYLGHFNKLSYSTVENRLQAYQLYLQAKEHNRESPSFYFNMARLFLEKGVDVKVCVAIITNALEINVQDIQMFRAVAYFLLQLNFIKQAILMFERVMELAPEEPQSFLDLGLAQFMDVRKQKLKNIMDKELLSKAIDNVMTVLRRTTWQPRFDEIEYPALVWINWMVGYGKYHGLDSFYPKELDEFGLLVKDFKMGLLVSLGWDTDKIDIDLHINEPTGFHVYYGAKNSPSGGYLSKDFTQGYGPEVYSIKNPPKGKYGVSVRYFASHQDSKTTGATSTVVWRVTNIGDYANEDVLFKTVRLTVNQSEHHIMDVFVN